MFAVGPLTHRRFWSIFESFRSISVRLRTWRQRSRGWSLHWSSEVKRMKNLPMTWPSWTKASKMQQQCEKKRRHQISKASTKQLKEKKRWMLPWMSFKVSTSLWHWCRSELQSCERLSQSLVQVATVDTVDRIVSLLCSRRWLQILHKRHRLCRQRKMLPQVSFKQFLSDTKSDKKKKEINQQHNVMSMTSEKASLEQRKKDLVSTEKQLSAAMEYYEAGWTTFFGIFGIEQHLLFLVSLRIQWYQIQKIFWGNWNATQKSLVRAICNFSTHLTHQHCQEIFDNVPWWEVDLIFYLVIYLACQLRCAAIQE